MGNYKSRSSSVRPEETKNKWRKKKRKRLPTMETSIEGDQFLIHDENEGRHTPDYSYDKYEEWSKKINQHQHQQHQQLSNINGDPPGAPRTYPNNYPVMENDVMTQSWSASHDLTNRFFQNNTFPKIKGTSTLPYDPDRYSRHNKFINQTQSMALEDRSSKKVQFAYPIQQQINSHNSLTSTQSWPETSSSFNDLSNPTIRQEPLLHKSSLHQSIATIKTNTPLNSALIEKPIYIGIDHGATLAERGQTTATKHHHKNVEKKNSTINNHHRSRSNLHNQQKSQESTDSSNSKNNILSQGNNSTSTHRTLTTTSTSTIIPNKQIQHTESLLIHDNEMKKIRNNRPISSQHSEQQPIIENYTKSIRNRENASQQKQHQRSVTNQNDSPARTETIRRTEIKQQNVPITSQSQQRQKQSSSTNTTSNISRTRV